MGKGKRFILEGNFVRGDKDTITCEVKLPGKSKKDIIEIKGKDIFSLLLSEFKISRMDEIKRDPKVTILFSSDE